MYTCSCSILCCKIIFFKLQLILLYNGSLIQSLQTPLTIFTMLDDIIKARS